MRRKFLYFLCLACLLLPLAPGMPPAVMADRPQTASVTMVSPSNACFIPALYHELLNRGPSSTELSDGMTYLTSHARTQYASILLAGSDYQTGLIQDGYQKFLRRSATTGEINSGLSFFGAGGTDEQFSANLVSSNEYFNLPHVGATNAGYVTALYQDLLERTPSPSELSFWMGALSSGTTRLQVAQSILSSTEYWGDLIRGWYQRFLSRSATTSEVNAGVSFFSMGGTDEQIIATIVGSDEYFNQAGICKMYLPIITR